MKKLLIFGLMALVWAGMAHAQGTINGGGSSSSFKITATADSNGSVSPTNVLLPPGQTQIFAASPASGYSVNEWFLDGSLVQSSGITYVLSNARANHTLSVTFKESITGGLIQLNNRIPGIVDARILLPDGSGAGAGWTAQLYTVTTKNGVTDFEALFPTTTFRSSSENTAGYLTSVDVIVPGTATNDKATVVLRVYDGETFETSERRGESAAVNVTLGGGLVLPASLVGLVGFTIPESQPEVVDGGLVSFNNRLPGTVDARVVFSDGTGAGPGWTAQLYGSRNGGELLPLFPTTVFRTSSPESLGYVSPVDVAFPGTQPGDQATIVMKVFNGDTPESSTIAAQSNPFTVILGGGTQPPANLAGLEGFTIIEVETPRVEGGLISFNNRVIGVVDARVLVTDGSGAGEGWTAQLYGAPEGAPLVPLMPQTRFRTTSASTMGYVVPVDVAVPGVDPGQKATVVMTVFNGDTYETSLLAGQSDPVTITLGGGTLPPANLIGLEGFTVTSDEAPSGNVGLVNLNNRIGGVVEARVTLADGTGAGPGWKAQLYGAAEGETLVPLLPATTFRTTSAEAMGYVNPVVATVPGLAPGQKATLMLTAFNGETYESSMLSGHSELITITLGGGTLPPANLSGLRGFSIAGNPPVIFRQPSSQTALIGSSVTLSVTASGTGDLGYQWRFNRTAIPGANTAELTLSNIQTSQAGLYTVAVSNASGVVISAVAEVRVITPSAKGDLNHDGMTDIVFEDANGSLAVWFMEGAKLQSGKFLNPIRTGDKQWRVVGLGDFNQDGSADVLFQHDSGTLSLWYMDGINRTSATFLDPTDPGDKKWRVVTVDDFNDDGKPDIALQHEDGWVAVWYMDGAHLENAEFFQPNHPGDKRWGVVGSGDFNNDGKPDLVFQHQDGTLALWYLDGIRLTEATLLDPSRPNETPWRVQSVLDLDHDGKPDLLFQHRGVGTIAVWYMDGENLKSAELLNPSRPGGTWEVVGP